MAEKGILVHGYWISRGANELSLKQIDAAARAYLNKDGSLLLCPTGVAEWGQGFIGQFIRQGILDKYPQVPERKAKALTDRSIVTTRRELISALRYFQEEGIYQVLDLSHPVHLNRIELFIEELKNKPPMGLRVANFEGEYKTTTDYLTTAETKKLVSSPAHLSFKRSERLRYALVKNKPLYFFVEELLPDSIKSRMEAFQTARIRGSQIK